MDDQQNAVVAEASSVVAAPVIAEVAVVRNDHSRRQRSASVPVPMQGLAVQSNMLVLLSTPSISVARRHSRQFVKLPSLSLHHSRRRRRRRLRSRSKNHFQRIAVLPVCRVHHLRSLNRTSAVPLPWQHQRKLATTVAAAVQRAAPRIAMTAMMTSSSSVETSVKDPVAARRVPPRAASLKPPRRSQTKTKRVLAVRAAAAAASTAMMRVPTMSVIRRSRYRSVMRRA